MHLRTSDTGFVTGRCHLISFQVVFNSRLLNSLLIFLDHILDWIQMAKDSIFLLIQKITSPAAERTNKKGEPKTALL